MSKRVCVIGAGIAGICSARYLKEEGIDFTVLEATRYIGGTWRYDPRTGTDENGVPIYTSMYSNLKTNLPKATMEIGGYPLSKHLPSFPKAEDYLKYLQSYVEHIDILKYIQFLHKVISVRRIDDKWRIRHEQVVTKEVFEEDYDYVIIGTGHLSKPNMPNIKGEELFKGTIIHSHDYKSSDPYKDRRVLIVGDGPSGKDIGVIVGEVCKRLVHSKHAWDKDKAPFPSHYVKKLDIKEFNETGVIFVDGSFEELDDVIYCTGFQYYYPFLDESSGLTIDPRCVTPLYKHMVNVNQPTMMLLGLIFGACIAQALEAQARYAAALIKGKFNLPSREDMMKEWQSRMDIINDKKQPISFIHMLGDKEDEYYADLSKESGTQRIPPVMSKIRYMDVDMMLENIYTFRNYEYIVIDDQTFTWSMGDSTRASRASKI